MTPEEDEALWKERFQAFAAVRMWGLLLTLSGLLLALRNPFFDEVPALGAPMAVVGGLLVLLGPKMLRRRWDREDEGA
ncbi:hypothetical protein WJT74_00465 [Sphingomicrobium sp. XHP0239]|uniref:hypothetical protein n=1 Tax=Sphingomicrobium maritimum TaxID=3133972 RepID=UPI0031CCC318